jgi:hypothetical protein
MVEPVLVPEGIFAIKYQGTGHFSGDFEVFPECYACPVLHNTEMAEPGHGGPSADSR